VEYARNVIGIDADFEETDPTSLYPLISRLECSLAGVVQKVRIAVGSRAAAAYGQEEAVEKFTCNYGLNPFFRKTLDWDHFRISGVDDGGAVRMMELDTHPFYVGTLFLPQLSSSPGEPHPLVTAFLEATKKHT
jgi:CTP synthase (UTP-ammonia lyase)